MGVYTTYTKNKLQDHLHGVASFTQPDHFIGLSTANPTDDGSGIAEPASSDYAREEVTAWDASAAGVVANTNAIEFTRATESWGAALTHWFISDAASGGNILKYGALPASITVVVGVKVIIPAGDLTATLSDPA